ncbi:MAG: hypothetical protein K2X74_09075 [Acetobacteraceae bacterium]|nr:hypothetical protein [Acetobacteraceae bacterium]
MSGSSSGKGKPTRKKGGATGTPARRKGDATGTPARKKGGATGTPAPKAKPIPALQRMRVANWERWGDLIKAWTTGRPHRANRKKYPVPRTLEELKAQCAELDVGLYVPPFVKDLVVYSHEKSTMVLRLPPPDLVAASEEQLRKGAPYNLPAFYADALGLSGEVPHFATDDELMDFHASRIGDYTISMCQ